MDNSYQAVHDVLVNLFYNITDIEERALTTGEFSDISNNDMHIIEAVGVQETKNMSAISKALSVTMGTLTIAMNNLVKKGYVTRRRSEKDRRVVCISLTEKGVRAYRHHEAFHAEMIDAVMADLSCEEEQILAGALSRLQAFFEKKRDEAESLKKKATSKNSG